MIRKFTVSTLACIVLSPASGQVKIHDPVVSVLAKPYGIEKRIKLESIDGLYHAKDGGKRLKFTLRSSGVKHVRLNRPDFSLDIVMPDGSWASLGSLGGCRIDFPVTGETKTTNRTYIATLKSRLGSDDLEAYLERAAASGKRVRLLGKAEMVVSSDGSIEFSKKNLKLEVHGPLRLSSSFGVHSKASSGELPELGLR